MMAATQHIVFSGRVLFPKDRKTTTKVPNQGQVGAHLGFELKMHLASIASRCISHIPLDCSQTLLLWAGKNQLHRVFSGFMIPRKGMSGWRDCRGLSQDLLTSELRLFLGRKPLISGEEQQRAPPYWGFSRCDRAECWKISWKVPVPPNLD